MNITSEIEAIDLALKYKDYLIIADLHLGLEEALNKQGILIPKFQFQEILEKLEKIIKEAKPKTIIINGDLKHEFGLISEQEWSQVFKLLEFLTKKSKVILIKGNHDTILEPIAKKFNIEILDFLKIYNITILHGDKIIPIKTKTLIIAHEHPAISISNKIRSELYKCFLKGKYKNITLIVQPSFNLVNIGSNILKEKILSPYISNIPNFEAFIVSDKIYDFGKISTLK